MPSDLRPAAGLDHKPNPNPKKLLKVTLSSLDSTDTGHFGRQAQAVSLLDRLLTVMRLSDVNTETKLAELDAKIRSFLEAVLHERGWEYRLHCVPAAMCVR